MIYTSTDKFAPAKDIYLSRARYYEKKDDEVKYQLFTDRAIYRPGQKVHATAVSYIVKKGLDASVPGKSMELKFILRDANWKQVLSRRLQPTNMVRHLWISNCLKVDRQACIMYP